MSSSVSLWLSPLDSNPTQRLLQQHVRAVGGPLFRPHVTLHHFDVPASELSSVVAKVKAFTSNITDTEIKLEFGSVVKGESYHRSVYLGNPSNDSASVLTNLKKKATETFGPGKGGGVRR
jgi:2'-5' RNA ligase